MENIIFGAGQRGKRYLHMLQELQITVHYFCDNNEKLQGSCIEGVQVIPPQLLKQHQKANILLANRFAAKEIRQQLDAMGIHYTEEIAEVIFRSTRLNIPMERKHIDACRQPVPPFVSVLIVGADMDGGMAGHTFASIAAWDLMEAYEVVVWKGRDTKLNGRKVLVLEGGSAISAASVRELLHTGKGKGAVAGSKSVTADGRIVQAGYVVHNKDTILSYGYGESASEPEYEYVRECDAAALDGMLLDAVHADALFSCLEGFQDLKEAAVAFSLEMRKRQVKIIFQPFSLVVGDREQGPGHRIQNIGLSAECMRYLESCPDPAAGLFWQANRGSCFCRAFVADVSIAKYDTNAGNRSTYNYIQIFLELGMWVAYIPDNFVYECRYAMHFQKMGIFVAYGERWKNNWEMLLEGLLPKISYAFLNRPGTAAKYVEIIRQNSDAVIVHYGHDLHYLRLEREYGITGDEKLLAEAARYKELEYSLVPKVDVTGYPSMAEVGMLKKIFPRAEIELFPLYFYGDAPKAVRQEGRSGILFVGGFSHRPNADAAVWLVEEILPQLRKGGVRDTVYLVGSNPTEAVWKLKGKDVVVTGYVTEQELQAYYGRCFVAVIPLRFGAGMKGKVLEAMHEGIPVVTTDIGAEGLENVGRVIGIGNTAGQIARKTVYLYENREMLPEIAKAERSYISSHFQKDAIRQMVRRHVERRMPAEKEKRL